MAGRIHELLIRINGQLDQSIMKSLANMKNALKNLDTQKNINQVSNHAVAFKLLRDASQKAMGQMSQSRKTIAQLNAEMEGNRRISEQINQQYNESKNRTDSLKSQRDNLKNQKLTLQTQLKGLQEAGINKQSEAYKNLREQIRATNDQIRSLNNAYRASSAETRQFAQANRLAQTELQSMYNEIQRQQSALNRLQTEQSDRSSRMSEHQRYMRESGYSGNFDSQSRRIERDRVRRESYDNARSRMTERYQKVQDSYDNFQQAQGFADTILSPFKKSLDVAMDFEVATSRTQAIMSGGGEVVDMSKIVSMAKKLGAETNFTASQAMDSAYYAAIAGWNEQQILAAMPTSLDLANAGGIGIDRAMDIISDEMTAYGLDTKNESVVRKFADQFGYTITKANTNAEDLHLAASYIAPVANSVAASNEEAMAMIAMAANAGIKGSKAGTSIRTGLLAFGTSTQSSEELAQELGISVSDATKMQLEAQAAMNKAIDPAKLAEIESMQDGQSKVFAKLKAFSQGIKDMSPEEQSALIAEVFKKNAYSGMATIVKAFQNTDENGISEIEKFVEGLKNSEGTAAAISKNMTNNLRGDITILESTMESLSQNIGEAILPAMRKLIQAITPILAGISKFALENQELVKTLAIIAAGISGIIIAGAGLALLGNVFLFAVSGLQTFYAGLKMLPSIISVAISGIRMIPIYLMAANAQMLNLLRSTMLMATGGVKSLIAGFQSIPIVARSVISSISMIPMYLSSILVGMKSLATVEGLKGLVMGARAIAVNFVTASVSMLPIIAGAALLAGAAYVIISNWSIISPFLSRIFDGLKEKLSASFNIISEQFEHIGNLFSRIGDSSGFETFSATVIAVFTGIISFIAGSIASIVSMIANLFASLENITAGVGDFFNSLMNLDLNGMIDAGKRIAHGIIDGFKAVFVEGIGGIISSAIDSVNFGTTVFDRVTSMWNAPQVESTAQGMRAANESYHGGFGGSGGNFDVPPIDSTAQKAISSVQEVNDIAQQAHSSVSVIDTTAQQAVSNVQAVESTAQQATSNVQNVATTVQTIDTATQQTSTNMQAFDTSMQQTSTVMQNFDTSMQQTSANLQFFDTSMQTTSTNFTLLDTVTQSTSTNMQLFDQTTQLTSNNMNLLGASSQMTSSSIMNMSTSADQVTSAFASKAAEISAIQINAPTISIPAGGVPIAHNALGGIYNRGSFLTTFAEKSPEAAIPIDGSQRAQDLWIQTGQLLGLLPNENTLDGGSFNPLQPSGVFNSESQISNANPVFNLSINVTGNSDQSMVDQISTSMRESFEDMWRNFQYERERVAFS